MIEVRAASDRVQLGLVAELERTLGDATGSDEELGGEDPAAAR